MDDDDHFEPLPHRSRPARVLSGCWNAVIWIATLLAVAVHELWVRLLRPLWRRARRGWGLLSSGPGSGR